MTTIHKPRLDDETFNALQKRAHYLKKRTGQHITVGQTIRWLATGKITLTRGANGTD